MDAHTSTSTSTGQVNLESYTCYSEDSRGYTIPPKEQLEGYKVIVATCIMAGKLMNIGLKSYFDVVVVDEAGHAIEPEVKKRR
jgi:hypothetical protein